MLKNFSIGFTIFLLSLSALPPLLLYGDLYTDLFCGGNSGACLGILLPPILWSCLFAAYVVFFLLLSSRPIYLYIKNACVQKSFSKNDLRTAYLSVLIIVLPLIVTTAVKSYFIPPSFSHKIINVDMGFADYKVPRNYLKDWALFLIPPNTEHFYAIHSARYEGELPFVRFSLSVKTIDPEIKSDRIIEIYVSPKSLTH